MPGPPFYMSRTSRCSESTVIAHVASKTPVGRMRLANACEMRQRLVANRDASEERVAERERPPIPREAAGDSDPSVTSGRRSATVVDVDTKSGKTIRPPQPKCRRRRAAAGAPATARALMSDLGNAEASDSGSADQGPFAFVVSKCPGLNRQLVERVCPWPRGCG